MIFCVISRASKDVPTYFELVNGRIKQIEQTILEKKRERRQQQGTREC